MSYEVVVIGTSAGGIDALKSILEEIKKPISVPIIIVQHLSPRRESCLASILTHATGHFVRDVEEKEIIEKNVVYLAPSNYHILVEKDRTFSLTVDERVSYARPSIDILFETAADAYREHLIGVILTGANHDGARGLEVIKAYGGYTIIQVPETAYASEMPQAAIDRIYPDEVIPLKSIGQRINQLLASY